MAIPTYERIMLPLLEVLRSNEIYTNNECIEILARRLDITEEEMNLCFPSGKKRVFYDRVNWAKTYMKKAGLVEAPKRGLVRITKLGLELLQENPKQLKSKDLLRYDSFYEFVSSSNKDQNHNENNEVALNEKTPSEEIANAFENLKTSLADEILEKINSCSFEFFEKLVVEL